MLTPSGAGELCRATHAKPGRDVAVKALPERPSVRLEARARSERGPRRCGPTRQV